MPLVPLIVHVPRVLLSTELFNNKLFSTLAKECNGVKNYEGN